MASQNDARRIAMALPGVTASTERFAFSVENKGKAKGFIWAWNERIDPRKPRVPNPQVLAARVANETEKAALLGADPDKFFTEPHYHGFPAVLVRLPAVSIGELRQVITEAWRCQAPKDLRAAYDAGDAAPRPKPAAVRPRAASNSRPSAPKRKPARKVAARSRAHRAR
ncbi:MAG TPA: hypothetical protein VF516_01645 [Kofleriaceae bacterium]